MSGGGKLCHMADLPSSSYYLSVEIKHLLPVHHPRFIDNLNTILHNQANRMQWPLYYDPSLRLTQHSYAWTTGGWCEDIDHLPHNHLKTTLQLAAIALNYLHALLQTSAEQPSLSNYHLRVQHLNDSPLSQQPLDPLTTPYNSIGYNIYKRQDKGSKRFIFIVGRQSSAPLRMYSLLSSIRGWNMARLKSVKNIPLNPNRVGLVLEHLVTILQNMMGEAQHNQSQKKQLKINLQHMQPQQALKTVRREGIHSQEVVLFSRFELTSQQPLKQQDIMHFAASVLAELIRVMPTNTGVSYASRTIYSPALQQLTLLWATSYKPPYSATIQWASDELIETTARQAMHFMRVQSITEISNIEGNIADEMLKQSMRVLSRYQPQDQITAVKGPQSKRGVDCSFEEMKSNSGSYERMSMLSKISFKERNFPLGTSRALEATQALNSTLNAYRDKDYAELLRTVQRWQQLYGTILSPTELRQALESNCSQAKRIASQSQLTPRETSLLKAIAGVRYALDPQDICFMFRQHLPQRQGLMEVLFQPSNAGYLTQIGLRLCRQNAASLYQKYLSNSFKMDKDHILVMFLKRFVGLFCGSGVLGDLGEAVPMPTLLALLEGEWVQEMWVKFSAPLVPLIFRETSQIKAASPFMSEIMLALSTDHHQQLVNGLLADLTFQAVYFSHDDGTIANGPYTQSEGLRERKLLQLLRHGGFNKCGYELKHILRPILIEYQEYKLPSSRIYDRITLTKPTLVTQFIHLMVSAHPAQQTPISEHFKAIQHIPVPPKTLNAVFLKSELERYNYQYQTQIQLTAESQSGIFKDLLSYNPHIKIAGKSLSEVLSSRVAARGEGSLRFDLEWVLSEQLCLELQQSYQYLQMVLRMRERYEDYESMSEDQRIYLRQIMHQLLCRKSNIQDYMLIDGAVKQARAVPTDNWVF